MNRPPANRPSFVPGRRYRVGLGVAVGVVALAVSVGLANYLAATRLRWRRDLSAGARTALAPLTREVLRGLTNDVKVTVLFDREAALFGHVDGLLRQYALEQPRLRVRVIDYHANPGAALEAKAAYRLGADSGNVVIFDNGLRPPRLVGEGELSVYDADVPAMLAGEKKEIRRSAFKGELLFTSALATLNETAGGEVLFLTGHNEHRPDSDDQLYGYRRFAELVTAKGVPVRPLRLEGTNPVPATCELLVIAGPTGSFTPGEVERLEAYLQRGGRLLLLTAAAAVKLRLGLEPLLERWGVGLPPWYAGDEQNTRSRLDVFTDNLGNHPITGPLRRDQGRLYFPLPRVVGKLPAEALPADAPKAEILAATGPAGLTKSDIRDGNIAFRPGVDRRGEIPLAVAAEQGGVAGVTAGRGTARVVVIGDSTLFGNEVLDGYHNREFADLTVAWLLDRTQFLAIGPRPIREYRLELTDAQMRTLRWLLLGGLPGGVLLLGFVVWFRRRA
jgi:hypothetical protein